MPASTPAFGLPKVALVMAKLMVDCKDHGSRFFIVPICNEREMYRGVESIRLGPRSGTSPLDFSVTRFNNVLVPHSALVSSKLGDYSMPKFPLQAWWDEVWRIPYGTMAVTAPWISSIKAAAYIAGKYSMHRCITGKENRPLPIISFRTQQWPIAHATAVAHVMSTWYPFAIQQTMDMSLDHRVRHGIAVIAKTTACRHFQRCVPEVAERCGAQGTFEHNYMARIEVGFLYSSLRFLLIMPGVRMMERGSSLPKVTFSPCAFDCSPNSCRRNTAFPFPIHRNRCLHNTLIQY